MTTTTTKSPRYLRRDRIAEAVVEQAETVLADWFPGAPVDAWRGLTEALGRDFGLYLDERFAYSDGRKRSEYNERTARERVQAAERSLMLLARPWRPVDADAFHASPGVFGTLLYGAGCQAYREAGR